MDKKKKASAGSSSSGSESSLKKTKPTGPVDPRGQSQRKEVPLGVRPYTLPLLEAVKDEVALEGLDGITIQGLRVRLEARADIEIDGFEDIATALWTQMKMCKYFRFYMLPKARPDLVPYSWDSYRDERGNAYEPLHSPEEIYLYNPVEDKEKGIRGSCMEFDTRKDITEIIKHSAYTDIIQLFGNRLVIVAHQYFRELALFGPNYRKYLNLSIVQYCIMERVGRARFSGEITRGKISSSCMNIPPKTLFYMRKRLIEERLILRQPVSVKFANCRCPALVTVFHLPKFYKRFESISSLNTRIVFSWLNNSPKKSIPVERVVSKYGKHTMRSLMNQFPSLLETAWDHVSVENDDEDGTKKKKLRAVRVLRLQNSDVKMQSQIMAKVLEGQSVEDVVDVSGEGSAETPQQEENEAAISIGSASSFSGVQILRPAHAYLTSTGNHRLYMLLVRSGMGGLTQLDISTLMSLTPLESRAATRYMVRHNACREGMVKIYKQKAFTYILTIFPSEDLEIHLAMQEKFMFATLEMEKIRTFIEQQETKKLHERMEKAKKLRALRQKRLKRNAALQQESVTNDPSVTTADPLSDVVEKEVEPAMEKPLPQPEVPSTSKKHSKSKKKHKSKSSAAVEVMPESLSISIPLARTRTPERDFSVSAPTLCLVNACGNVPKVSENAEDMVGLSPTSQLVAVISTRETSNAHTERSIREPESTGKGSEDADDETQIDAKDLLSMISQNAYEDALEDEDPSTTRRKSRGDSVDQEIKRRMTRKRVDWKEWEDRFILLSFIASSLFISKYNYSKVFFFNSPQIRDIMLKKTDGKSNKTSAAIRRRIHFLLHQQPRFEEYIALAGASLRDPTLYEIYIKDHMQPPQQKIYFNPPIAALESAIDYLREKFAVEEELNTAETGNSLNGIDTLLFLRQLKRAEFYWKATMFSIFIPMGETSEKRADFYRSWRSYRRELKDAREKLTTMNGENVSDQLSPSQDTSQEVVPVHTSQGELDDPKTPQELYMEFCYKFLRFISKQCTIMFNNMLIFGSLNLKGFQIVSVDMSTAHSNISACLRECNSDAEVRLWTARCIVMDFIFSGDSSKLVESYTIDKCGFPLERAARSLQRAKVLVHSKRTGLMGVSKINLRAFVAGLPPYSYDEMLDFLRYLDESAYVDSLACNHVGILQGVVELTDFLSTSIRVTESIFTLNEDWTALYDGLSPSEKQQGTNQNKKPEEVFAKKSKPKPLRPERRRRNAGKAGAAQQQSSKRRRLTVEEEEEEIDALIDDGLDDDEDDMTKQPPPQPPKGAKVGLEEGESYISSSNSNALRLLRIRLNQAAGQNGNVNGFVEKDFFTLNLPSLEFSLPKRSNLNHCIAGSSHPFSSDGLKDLRKRLVELVFHRVPPAPFKAPNLEKVLGRYTKIFELISMTGVVGLSGAYLKTVFDRSLLVKGLKHMIEAKLLFSVGVAHRRFVTYNNINDWVVPIRPSAGGDCIGHVIMRPWITSMGGLSWITVSRLLTSLLGQLQKPSIPLNELCQAFAPTLSAVEAIVLIEVLAHLKYLTIYRIKNPKVTLWSKPNEPSTSDIEYHADTLVDITDVYVAVSPYLTFLHSQLNQTIQRAYKKQTLGEQHKAS